MLKHIYLISILILSGCGVSVMGLPSDLKDVVPDDAPPAYKQGWNDGCESGVTTYGNGMYKFAYSFKQDQSQMKNSMYYKSWVDGMNFCRSYVRRDLQQGMLWGDGSSGRSGSMFGDGGSIFGYLSTKDLRSSSVAAKGDSLYIFEGMSTPGWKRESGFMRY